MALKRKAVALLSGGLDSSLAVKLMLQQGIEITAVNFTSLFCNCSPKKGGCNQARKVGEKFGIPVRIIPKGMDYIKMLENPRYGYGRGMNACLDCRIYMLRKVREFMPDLEASFVITGEVLGQRPMSQFRHSLRLIEKESGLEGLILRPLSAQHFPPTRPELEGIVDRQKLLAISGRSRKPQIELAKDLGLRDYPCPAGGCLLTDGVIAGRLRDLFAHLPGYDLSDVHFLKMGRHFRLPGGLKIVLGRNQEENARIEALARPGATLYFPQDFRGPMAVASGCPDPNGDQIIGQIIARYSQDEKDSYGLLKRGGEGAAVFAVTRKFPPEKLEELRIG